MKLGALGISATFFILSLYEGRILKLKEIKQKRLKN
jgi:hypothetical protein